MFPDVADNTEDGFSYVILPVNEYIDIPLTLNPVTLVMSVVLIRIVGSYNSPHCVGSKDHVKFYDRYGNEWFGSSETTETPSTTTVPLDINSDHIGNLNSTNDKISYNIQTLPESLPSSNSILEKCTSPILSHSYFSSPRGAWQ